MYVQLFNLKSRSGQYELKSLHFSTSIGDSDNLKSSSAQYNVLVSTTSMSYLCPMLGLVSSIGVPEDCSMVGLGLFDSKGSGSISGEMVCSWEAASFPQAPIPANQTIIS